MLTMNRHVALLDLCQAIPAITQSDQATPASNADSYVDRLDAKPRQISRSRRRST
jgi:hypothetical protein